mgnify:CR=1 FL=1
MSKKTIFTGSGVALITPFKDGKIDYEAFKNILEFQIYGGTDAIIVCGTTGECATLSDAEHRQCIEFVIEQVDHRVPVVAGTGSNDTRYCIELSKHAARAGADGLLLVTPYYNKASANGLIRHFNMVADSTDCPGILYNVPSRTGCNIPVPVFKELSKHPNLVGVKEASGSISQVAKIIAECGDAFDIYSGNDDEIVPVLALGGKGVISVLANPMPRETHDICDLWFKGKTKESAALQLKLLSFCNALFYEVNPIPVKSAMAAMGLCTDELRLPLCDMEESNKQKMFAIMKDLELI